MTTKQDYLNSLITPPAKGDPTVGPGDPRRPVLLSNSSTPGEDSDESDRQAREQAARDYADRQARQEAERRDAEAQARQQSADAARQDAEDTARAERAARAVACSRAAAAAEEARTRQAQEAANREDPEAEQRRLAAARAAEFVPSHIPSSARTPEERAEFERRDIEARAKQAQEEADRAQEELANEAARVELSVRAHENAVAAESARQRDEDRELESERTALEREGQRLAAEAESLQAGARDGNLGTEAEANHAIDRFNARLEEYGQRIDRFNDERVPALNKDRDTRIGSLNRDADILSQQAQQIGTRSAAVGRRLEERTEDVARRTEAFNRQADLAFHAEVQMAAVEKREARAEAASASEREAREAGDIERERAAAAQRTEQARLAVSQGSTGRTDAEAERTALRQVEQSIEQVRRSDPHRGTTEAAEIHRELEAARTPALTVTGDLSGQLRAEVEAFQFKVERFQEARDADVARLEAERRSIERAAAEGQLSPAALQRLAASYNTRAEAFDKRQELQVAGLTAQAQTFDGRTDRGQVKLDEEFLKETTHLPKVETSGVSGAQIAKNLAIGLTPVVGTAVEARHLAQEWAQLSTGKKSARTGLLALSAASDVLIVAGGAGLLIRAARGSAKAATTVEVIYQTEKGAVAAQMLKESASKGAKDQVLRVMASSTDDAKVLAELREGLRGARTVERLEVENIGTASASSVREMRVVERLAQSENVIARPVIEVESAIGPDAIAATARAASEHGLKEVVVRSMAGRAQGPAAAKTGQAAVTNPVHASYSAEGNKARLAARATQTQQAKPMAAETGKALSRSEALNEARNVLKMESSQPVNARLGNLADEIADAHKTAGVNPAAAEKRLAAVYQEARPGLTAAEAEQLAVRTLGTTNATRSADALAAAFRKNGIEVIRERHVRPGPGATLKDTKFHSSVELGPVKSAGSPGGLTIRPKVPVGRGGGGRTDRPDVRQVTQTETLQVVTPSFRVIDAGAPRVVSLPARAPTRAPGTPQRVSPSPAQPLPRPGAVPALPRPGVAPKVPPATAPTPGMPPGPGPSPRPGPAPAPRPGPSPSPAPAPAPSPAPRPGPSPSPAPKPGPAPKPVQKPGTRPVELPGRAPAPTPTPAPAPSPVLVISPVTAPAVAIKPAEKVKPKELVKVVLARPDRVTGSATRRRRGGELRAARAGESSLNIRKLQWKQGKTYAHADLVTGETGQTATPLSGGVDPGTTPRQTIKPIRFTESSPKHRLVDIGAFVARVDQPDRISFERDTGQRGKLT